MTLPLGENALRGFAVQRAGSLPLSYVFCVSPVRQEAILKKDIWLYQRKLSFTFFSPPRVHSFCEQTQSIWPCKGVVNDGLLQTGTMLELVSLVKEQRINAHSFLLLGKIATFPCQYFNLAAVQCLCASRRTCPGEENTVSHWKCYFKGVS